MNLQTVLAVNNECYKAGRTIRVKGIVVHSTGANNKTLRRYVQSRNGEKAKDEAINKILGANTGGNDWNRPTGARYDASGKLYYVATDKDIYGNMIPTIKNQVCVHGFIGTLADGSIATYQQLPWDARGWHGGSGKKGCVNDTHIGFEICEDGLTDADYFNKVYKEAAELCAYLCKLYDLNPLADGVLICHSEGFTRGIATNHGDVMHWFPKFGKSMDTFRKYVAELIGNATTNAGFKIGDIVKINAGAKTYDGKIPASFVYNGTYPIDELSTERAVLDKKGICTAYNVKDLALASSETTPTKPVQPEPIPVIPTIPKTLIMGKTVASLAQLREYVRQRNPADVHLVDLFLQEGEIEGVRGDLALMLACHETGFFLYEKVNPGCICRRSMNNFGGIGALNNNAAGNAATFKDDLEGVRAIIQHAKAYGSKDALKNAQVDPRFGLVTRGIALNWEDLGGKWAVPGFDNKTYASFDDAYAKCATYGQKIVKMLDDALKLKPEVEPEVPKKTSRYFSDIPENHWVIDIVDRAYELKITSGIGNGKFGFTDERIMMVSMCVNTYDAALRDIGKLGGTSK